MKTSVVTPLATERAVDVPLAGPTVVTRGHGWIHDHLRTFVGYRLGPPPNWLRDDARGWLPLYELAASPVAGRGAEEPARSLGFRVVDRLAMPDGRELRVWSRSS